MFSTIPHPLDWWAAGGYPEVMKQTGWSQPRARREVQKAIRKQGWRPVGHEGYQHLRAKLLRGDEMDHDLV